MYKVHTYLKNQYEIGEGPHWDDKTQTLLTVDILSSRIIRWDPLKEQATITKLPDSSVGAVVTQTNSDDLLVAAKLRFATVNEKTGETKTFHETNQETDTRFNDGKCDPVGRFWAGTMGEESSPGVNRKEAGSLFCLDKDGTVKKSITNIDISNGMAWTADQQKLFFIDSLKFDVKVYDYDVSTASITNPKVVETFDKDNDGIPDGMCIDADGNIYVAIFLGGKVVKIDPTTGKRLQEIKIENSRKITSVCFGGPTYEDLYVTSAHSYFKGKNTHNLEIGNSGSLFKVTELGAKGLPSVSYSPNS